MKKNPKVTARPALLRVVAILRRAPIMVLLQQKGGVGKSTTAYNLAVEAALQGLRVLLVDADPQRTCRTWGRIALPADHPRGTIDIRPLPGLHIVPMEAELAQRVPDLARNYDLVIIDTAGQLKHMGDQSSPVRAALLAADLVLLPCGPSPPDAWALFGVEGEPEADQAPCTGDLITQARAVRPQPPLDACVLLTRRRPRTRLGDKVRTKLEAGGLPILRSELRYLEAYQAATEYGQGVTAYAPSDPAATEVRQLLRELVQRAEKLASGGQP